MAPATRQTFLSEFAQALGLKIPIVSSNASDSDNAESILAESENAAMRIEARFSDRWLFISFTDLLKLPGFDELRYALAQAYCINPARQFVPSIEPVSRRLRFQRSIALDDSTLPAAATCATDLLDAMASWRTAHSSKTEA
ncbi:MAG: hypothetical protein OD811_00180 [Alphaproteobacteria bacterium]